MADDKDISESRGSLSQPTAKMRSRSNKRNKASSTCGQAPCFKQDQLSHPSLRQLQAKMVADNQQVQELIQPLLDTENGFMKELECFLSQQDVAALRRKELLHKHWTEHVWFPLQKRVEERVSSGSPTQVKRLQSLEYSDDLHHCNSKSETGHFKDTLCLYPYEGPKEKITPSSWKTGYKYTWKKPQKLSQNYIPPDKYAQSQVNSLSQASFQHLASTSKIIPRKDDAAQKQSGRLDTMPLQIDATLDGRCHQSRFWFSRWQCHQQDCNN